MNPMIYFIKLDTILETFVTTIWYRINCFFAYQTNSLW